MNDFTKEELKTIIDAFNCIYGAPSWRTTAGWDDELQAKIQSMIDNYCEHDPRDTKGAIGMYHCSVCGDMQVAGMRHIRTNNDNQ